MAIDPGLRQKITEQYPAFSWLLDIPEVGSLLAQAANEGWDTTRLQARLYATKWWKTTSATRRNWTTLVRTDPAEANRQRAERTNQIVAESMRLLGRRLSRAEEYHVIAMSLREGWSPAQITATIARFGRRRGIRAGEVRRTSQEVAALAQLYAFPVSAGTQLDWAFRVQEGTMTMDSITAAMVSRAKDKYAGNSTIINGLDRGLTVWDVMQPVIGRVSEELGVSADAFDLNEGWGATLVNYRDPDSGELRLMNDTEATAWARSQRQWRDTNNARGLASQLVDGITQRWGRR